MVIITETLDHFKLNNQIPMLMAKTRTYRSLRIPAPVLAQRILTFLQENKYEVSYSADEEKKSWCMIQARKFSKLRTATGNRRSLDIAIRKTKNDVKITIGSGQWGKNTILSAAPMIAFPVLGFTNFVMSAVSSKMSEADLWEFIDVVATQY